MNRILQLDKSCCFSNQNSSKSAVCFLRKEPFIKKTRQNAKQRVSFRIFRMMIGILVKKAAGYSRNFFKLYISAKSTLKRIFFFLYGKLENKNLIGTGSSKLAIVKIEKSENLTVCIVVLRSSCNLSLSSGVRSRD